MGHWQGLYGGGEVLFHRNPSDLERTVAHGGAEFRPSFRVIPLGPLGGFRLVAASDIKAAQEHDWKPSVSTRVSLEVDRAGTSDPPTRRWGIFIDAYTGSSPYGQFFRENARQFGLRIHFGALTGAAERDSAFRSGSRHPIERWYVFGE